MADVEEDAMICKEEVINCKDFYYSFHNTIESKIFFLTSENYVSLRVTILNIDRRKINISMGFEQNITRELITKKVKEAFFCRNPWYNDPDITIEINELVKVSILIKGEEEELYNKKQAERNSRIVTPNNCSECGVLVSDNSLTLWHNKWLCYNCFDKAKKGLLDKRTA